MRSSNRFKYTPEHSDKLIALMEKGLTNNQIAARLNISEKTFYKWLQDNEYFKEAYEIGDAKRFDYLMEQGDKFFLYGEGGPNDKGYKHWQKKMSYMYKNYSPESVDKGTTNNIQIGNMNVLSTKTDGELLEILNQKLEKLRMLPEMIDVKVEPTDE
jgi:hypothetical protein